MATTIDPRDFITVQSWNEALDVSTGYENQKLIDYYVENMRSNEPWNKWKLPKKPKLNFQSARPYSSPF